jgi:tripartite-type tricarboxylate transporter receptor subunit TctC
LDAMKQPDIKAKFETIGAESIGSTPEELGKHLNLEIARWGKLIKDQNIKSD